MQNFFKMG